MHLYGTQTSPYARRIRLLLQGESFEWHNVNVAEGEGRQLMLKYNPVRKVPFLVDGDTVLFDSFLIGRYVLQKYNRPGLTWEQESQVMLTSGACDSMVELILCKRSGMDVQEDLFFFRLQRERIAGVLETLDQQVSSELYNQWAFPAMCLYSLLDWADYRELINWEPYPNLKIFHQTSAQQPGVVESDPRL